MGIKTMESTCHIGDDGININAFLLSKQTSSQREDYVNLMVFCFLLLSIRKVRARSMLNSSLQVSIPVNLVSVSLCVGGAIIAVA